MSAFIGILSLYRRTDWDFTYVRMIYIGFDAQKRITTSIARREKILSCVEYHRPSGRFPLQL